MTKIKRRRLRYTLFLLPVLAAFAATSLFAVEKKEPASGKEEFTVVSGIVRLVGNEPFAEIVITDKDDNDWYIEKAGAQKLMPYIHKTVTLRGTLELIELTLANKKKIGMRRLLKNVELLQ